MNQVQDIAHMNEAGASWRCPALKFHPRGESNGPGLSSSRKHMRSCRCVLARRICGCTSVLAHTKGPVRRTVRLKVADTRYLCLVSRVSRRLFDGGFGWASASPDRLCGITRAQTLASSPCVRTLSGGSVASQPLVLVMSSNSRLCSTLVVGNHVAADAGVRRPTSFADAA